MKYDPSAGTFVPLALNTDYTIAAAGINNPAGGNIVLSAGNLAAGVQLVLIRAIPADQNTSIRSQGDFFPYVHENQFDRQVMQLQQALEALSRCIQIPPNIDPVGFSTQLPPNTDGLGGQFLIVNADGSGISTISAPGGFLKNTFVSAGDTYQLATTDDVLFVDSTGSPTTLLLPDATTCAGELFRIKRTTPAGGSAHVITVTPFGSQTVDAAAGSFNLNGVNTFLTLESDGSNWWKF
jgi:hypothetical protein